MQVRLAATALLLAALFLGLSHLLVLPPFEGFDEGAYYSRLRELGDGGVPQALGASRFMTQVEAYAAAGPRPYASRPPFTDNGGLTYRQFAMQGNASGLRVMLQDRMPYTPGEAMNWEAQHPPLPLRLLGALSAALGLGLKADLAVMRGVCFLAAGIALVLAVLANRQAGTGAVLLTAAWPLLFPMWLPEFARLGNDAVFALVAAAVWLLLVPALQHRVAPLHATALGLILGLGGLIKLFFLPLTVGVVLALLWCQRRAAWRPVAVLLLVETMVLMLGGFAGLFAPAMTYTLSDLNIARGAQGWSLPGFADLLTAVPYMFGSFVKSFLWAGTQSLVRPSALAYLPLLLLCGLALAGSLLGRLWRDRIAVAAFLLLLPVLGGFALHSLMNLVSQGLVASTGGWFLHIFAGPLAWLLATGLAQLDAAPALRALRLPALIAAAGFSLFVAYSQIMLFAGCVAVTADRNNYDFPADACLGHWGAAVRVLSMLAYPVPAALCFMIAGGLIVVAIVLLLSHRASLLPFSRREAA